MNKIFNFNTCLVLTLIFHCSLCFLVLIVCTPFYWLVKTGICRSISSNPPPESCSQPRLNTVRLSTILFCKDTVKFISNIIMAIRDFNPKDTIKSRTNSIPIQSMTLCLRVLIENTVFQYRSLTLCCY